MKKDIKQNNKKVGYRRWRINSFASITLFNGIALPESLKEATTFMSVSLSICEQSLYRNPYFFSYEAV